MPLLTEKERRILELAAKDLSDYKIARHLGSDPPTVNRSRKNALRKLREAKQDIAWVKQLGYPNIRKHAKQVAKGMNAQNE